MLPCTFEGEFLRRHDRAGEAILLCPIRPYDLCEFCRLTVVSRGNVSAEDLSAMSTTVNGGY
jgi:hypothetical protein